MLQRFYKIIVALFLVGCGPAVFGQQAAPYKLSNDSQPVSEKVPELKITGPAPLIKSSIYPRGADANTTITATSREFFSFWPPMVPVKNLTAGAAIAGNYYTQHFGIMCKKELQLEKATGIPFRFRLGSLQYCNALEGK